MTDEARFVTTGTLDEAFFRENAKYLISPQFHRRRMILAIVLNVLLLAEYFWLKNPAILWILAVYWITFYPFTLWYRRSAVKTSVKRFRETYADGKCDVTTSCTPEGVRSENQTTGGAGVVNYEHLYSLAVADHAFILMSKAGQYTVFFTDGLTEQEKIDLRDYLREKCPKLKIGR